MSAALGVTRSVAWQCGSGSNSFLFADGNAAGASDAVTGFSANDTVYLSGYGVSVETVLANAVARGGTTTITLSDNTLVTFVNVAAPSDLACRDA
ncbi:MAG: hypothetical protein ABSC95_08740 [Acetobacteraceae bacterium]